MYPGRGRGRPLSDELMPVESASIVVRKVPLNVTKEQMEQIFLKAGAIKYVYFPKVPRHFTTKYCFIKFHDIRRAREAQQLFDGYRLGDQWLQVVAYDPTYKFRHSSTQAMPMVFDDSASSRSTKHSSAAVPPMSFPTRPTARQVDTTTPTSSPPRSRPSSPISIASPIRCVRTEANLLTSKPSFLDQAPKFIDGEINPLIDSESEESTSDREDGDNGECRVVDNVLLDSEVGFWTWLEQRMRIRGPLHYKTTEIYNVLLKLPTNARKHFSWPLGAFRLRDKDRFFMIGPFLCLPEQVAEAKAKCLAMCCNWRAAFFEFWEPVAPSEIRNSNQLIQYLRKMLIQFGPQTVDDMKIRQVLQSLSPEMRAISEIKLPTTAGFVEFLESPNARKVFGISGTVFYLNQEHLHILRLC